MTQRIGKRMLVVGSSNAGKSTLARRRDLESWVHHLRWSRIALIRLRSAGDIAR